jgi:hypothetical protein
MTCHKTGDRYTKISLVRETESSEILKHIFKNFYLQHRHSKIISTAFLKVMYNKLYNTGKF